MADEKVRLIQTLVAREQVFGYCNNLEKLNSTDEIDQDLYKSKKEEYIQKLDALSAEIPLIKEALKKQLAEIGLNMAARKRDLASLEVSYKVGEIPLPKYQSVERPLRANISALEQNISELNSLIAADSVAACPVLQKPRAEASPVISTVVTALQAFQEKAFPIIRQKVSAAAIVARSTVAKVSAVIESAVDSLENPGAAADTLTAAEITTTEPAVPQAESTTISPSHASTPQTLIGQLPVTKPQDKSGLDVSMLAPPFSRSLPLGNTGALFDFRIKPLSLLKIASLIVSLLMFLSLVLPWLELPGFGLSVFNTNGWIASGCLVLFLAYTGATFVVNRGIRSVVHIVAGVICIVLWLIFRFTIFQEISRFAISPLNMMGVGFMLFIASAILAIIAGILEMFPAIDRQAVSFHGAGSSSVRILLAVTIVLSCFTYPKPAYAWAAITNNSIILFNISGDLTTHQDILRFAYNRLASDPAFADQKEVFPGLDDIQGWEGVVISNVLAAAWSGASWSNPNKGGPDAGGKSRDSEHMYNPVIGRGGAPTSVENYFTDLLERMYNGEGIINKSKMIDTANKDVAWSAHYLADVHVPYHTIGVPAGEISNNLSVDQVGPQYLWASSGIMFDADGNIDPKSIEKPDEGWGRNGDFSKDIQYFKGSIMVSDPDIHDWFDPWYYNGYSGLGPYGRIGTASHGQWESWAHKYIHRQSSFDIPFSYSEDWKNATPSFGLPQKNLENQAAQAKAFTIAAATETRAKLANYLKKPDAAFNRSVQRVMTLWRAAFTALRPSVKVKPDPGNPKLLKVTATIGSAERTDPAQNVQAKLTVTGGTVRGNAIQSIKEPITHDSPQILTWDVDSTNPVACKFKLEAICKYQKIPDLQYAVVEPGNNQIALNLSPGRVKQGDKVKMTVTISPASKIPPTVKEWGPLEEKPGNFSMKTEGTFEGVFTVKKDAKDKTYTITVEASQLNLTDSANITVGGTFNTCTIDFQVGVTMGGNGNPVFDANSRFSMEATGSFTGQRFDGTITRTVADNVFVPQGSPAKLSITMTPTADPKVFQVTDYRIETSYSCPTCYVPVKQGTVLLSGKKAPQAQLDTSRNVVTGRVSGESVRSYIDDFNWTIQYQSLIKPDNKTIYRKIVGTSVSYFQVTFQNK